MVILLISGVADREFEPRKGKANNYNIDICCYSTEHVPLWSNGVRAETEPNVYLRTAVLVSSHYKNTTQRVDLVHSRRNHLV